MLYSLRLVPGVPVPETGSAVPSSQTAPEWECPPFSDLALGRRGKSAACAWASHQRFQKSQKETVRGSVPFTGSGSHRPLSSVSGGRHLSSGTRLHAVWGGMTMCFVSGQWSGCNGRLLAGWSHYLIKRGSVVPIKQWNQATHPHFAQKSRISWNFSSIAGTLNVVFKTQNDCVLIKEIESLALLLFQS